ncbi:MAG: hypothetical protein JRJ01_03550 [Deltaproteobacteria bacterium]|nr:hypothetical protein [Deltaproteobacteria bacterium]
MKISVFAARFLGLFAFSSILLFSGKMESVVKAGAKALANPLKKVIYVDSYHAEYVPGRIMQRAARRILEASGVKMEVVYLDEKRKKSPEMLKRAALKAREVIERWKPDLIIAADDPANPANQYLIVPYYRDSDLPVVFIGVNWDAAVYGYPCRNVTGQIEVELIMELLDELRKYSRGDRIGMISGDTLTDRKALRYYLRVLHLRFDRTALVDDFFQWRRQYKTIQREVDILFFRNNSGIKGWNDRAAEKFVMENTCVPTGTVSTHLGRWVLVSFAKVNREFGEYAARTALRILHGVAPDRIPVTRNRQARILLNMDLARKLEIKFPMELIERATFIRKGRQ